MQRSGLRRRRVLALLATAALVISSAPDVALAERTDLEKLVRAVGKHLGTPEKLGKGLCVCMSDALPGGPKRVGILKGGAYRLADTRCASVHCEILPYDLSGN